ncbi:MAG TPA: DUF177 domain-containing protein [Candidatus Binatia bacterium]
MKIAVNQITESFKETRFQEGIDELNRTCAAEPGADFQFPSPLEVNLTYYRSGQEILFQGDLKGNVEGRCSRCLKKYLLAIEKKFDFVLTPEPLPAKNSELSRDELGLSYYSSDEIDLSPLIVEQAILALPTRALCDSECRGLCPSCGVDLNVESCRCAETSGDLRMAAFHNLRLGR